MTGKKSLAFEEGDVEMVSIAEIVKLLIRQSRIQSERRGHFRTNEFIICHRSPADYCVCIWTSLLMT